MSAGAVLVAGLIARLKAWGPLAGCAVFDAPPVRGGLPYVEVGEPVLGDWSGTTWTGREGRIAVTIADAGERPVRLRALAGEVEECLAAMPPALAGGWRLARLALVRSRLARGGGDRWAAQVEFQVRMYRANG